MKITFTKIREFDSLLPSTAKIDLPEWYKQTAPFIDNHKASAIINNARVTTATIKKCMPVFDAITAGYLIYSWSDIHIENINGLVTYKIDEPILQDHNIKQASKYPTLDSSNDLIPKFMNLFNIKTPKGHSCLFMPPAHRNNAINIMTAIVDTDTYNLPVHFPFTLKDRTFEGVIPKGTPLVQVIPFQRSNWEIEYGEKNDKENKEQSDKVFENDFNNYKDTFWSKKEYA